MTCKKFNEIQKATMAYVGSIILEALDNWDYDLLSPQAVDVQVPAYDSRCAVEELDKEQEELRTKAYDAVMDYYKACLLGNMPEPIDEETIEE